MATPVETPQPSTPESAPAATGAPESPAPVPAAPATPAAAPAATETPAQGQPSPDGLPQTHPDGTMTSGRGSNQDRATAPQNPATPAATPSPQGSPDPAAPAAQPQQVDELPELAQRLIKEARDEAAKARVNAKQSAAEEARKQMAQDIAKALGISTDETPAEEQLTPEQLRDLLAGERTTAKMARVELAVYRTAQGGGNFNASALLDSRAFLDAIKDIDPADTEAINSKIAEVVQANPWLAQQAAAPAAEPATPAAAPVAPQQTATPAAAPPPAVPMGGQFAGGPGGQPQDLSQMSIDDFRRLRRSPRS